MRIAVVNVSRGSFSGGYMKYLIRVIPELRRHSAVRSVDVYFSDAAAVAGASELQPVHVRSRRWFHSGQCDRELSNRGLDVVFVPSARAVRSSVPVVVMVRNSEPLVPSIPRTPIVERLRNVARRVEAARACSNATRVIAVSEFIRRAVVDGFGVSEDRVSLVYHGVDPVTLADAPRAVRGPKTIFTAGSIRPARGLEDAVVALAVLRAGGVDARLIVAGAADAGMERYGRHLRAVAAQLGVDGNIEWLGSIAPSEVRRHMISCDAFVMTSRAEACPNVLLEALSCGCPIVTVDIEPMPEVIGSAGSIYRPYDPQMLAESLRAVLYPRLGERREWADVAQKRAREFSWARTIDQTVRCLQMAARIDRPQDSSSAYGRLESSSIRESV
jgi:glycosyltransferase involved in cell wall biosynthesis